MRVMPQIATLNDPTHIQSVDFYWGSHFTIFRTGVSSKFITTSSECEHYPWVDDNDDIPTVRTWKSPGLEGHGDSSIEKL